MGWRESSSPPRGPRRPLGGCLCQPWGFEANMLLCRGHSCTHGHGHSHTRVHKPTHMCTVTCVHVSDTHVHTESPVYACAHSYPCATHLHAPSCAHVHRHAHAATCVHTCTHAHFRCVSIPRTQILLSRSPTPTPAPPASSQADLLPSRRLPVEHEEAQTPHISSWISLPCQKSSRLGQMPPLPTLS